MTEDEIQASIEGHNARNAALLELIKKKNADIAKLRTIEHHFWAENQQKAAALAKALYDKGFLVTVISPPSEDDDSRWNVEAEIRQSALDSANPPMVSDLCRLAARFDSDYDGWGTTLEETSVSNS